MQTKTMRTHVILPVQLVKEVDRLVGQRQRSVFIQNQIERGLQLKKQHAGLKAGLGAWKNNPLFRKANDVEKFIRSTRDEADKRLLRYS